MFRCWWIFTHCSQFPKLYTSVAYISCKSETGRVQIGPLTKLLVLERVVRKFCAWKWSWEVLFFSGSEWWWALPPLPGALVPHPQLPRDTWSVSLSSDAFFFSPEIQREAESEVRVITQLHDMLRKWYTISSKYQDKCIIRDLPYHMRNTIIFPIIKIRLANTGTPSLLS